MRPAALALFCVAVAACGDVGTAERLSSKETLDGIDVPTIGTVGDFPDPAHRHVVNVTADGRVVVDGATLTFVPLCDELNRRGTKSRGAELPGSPSNRLSGESVVIRVDGDVRWGATCALLNACAEAEFDRVFFGVRSEGDGVEGALAVFFPTEGGGEAFGDPSLDQRSVSIREQSGSGTPNALCAFLAALPESRTSKLLVAFDADHALSTRDALSMLDAVLRSGAASVEISVGHPPQSDAAFLAAARLRGAAAASREIVVTDESWTDATNAARHEHHGRHVLAPAAPPPPLAPLARVHGAFAGVTRPRSLVYCD